VGSKTFDGVWFEAYSDDHLPPHVHAFYGTAEVILDLDFEKWDIYLSKRRRNVIPPNAKKSDVRRIRRAAEEHGKELFTLWEEARYEGLYGFDQR
jgi:hypothetical protein